MHPSHNARPQHIRHHLHQPTMHPQRPPPVGINVGPQLRLPQHHHISNVPPHGGHQQMSPYIPPHQREANRLGHHQPRVNSQLHHLQTQAKFRPGTGRGIASSNIINQSSSPQLHGPQQSHVPHRSHSTQQGHSSQHSHGLQHNSQQHQISHKLPEVAKQTSVQKPLHSIAPHQGISTQPPVVSHQKITPQQIVQPQQILPLPQQAMLSQQTMQVKHSNSIKPMGLKHSHSSITFKTTQPNPLVNPIGVSYSQSSVHNHSYSSNKSFQTSYKPAQSHKPTPHQTISSRQNNSQLPRSSTPQKILSKTPSVTVNTSVPVLCSAVNTNQASISSPKSSPVSNQQPVPSSTPIIASTSIPASTTNSTPIPPNIPPTAPVNLHLQNKSIPNETSNTHSPSGVIPMVLQNTSTVLESRKATSDNHLKIQTTQQNMNPSVSTIQQEIQPESACGNSRNLSRNETLANTKEKTPMCLVNELARFNKIQHQYRLTSEQGPAHCKRFTVTLKLGDEDYAAEGLSIKKAQHAAAGDAIHKTSYQHPPVKTIRLKNGKPGIGNITPTVELNALLMKLGEPAMYVPNPDSTSNQMTGPTATQPQQQNGLSIPVHNQNYIQDYSNYNRPNSGNFYPSPRFQRIPGRGVNRGFMKYGSRFPQPLNGTKELCKMTLIVGDNTFVGFGMTPQLAKHDAATKALEVLKPLAATDGTTNEVQNTNDDDPNADLKSPISLVHELALKRNFTVSFNVKSERGPPHMKTFITLCKVGDIVTEGEGNGKKVSKKRAAEKMLEELKKLSPLSPSKINSKIITLKTLKRKPTFIKRKAKNLIKEKPEPEAPEEVNPISKLIQIQQALKEREPIYTLVEEKGAPRRREFIIEVSAGGHVARGTGANKKIAKKIAAKNLLLMMGYEISHVNEDNFQITNGSECSDKSRKTAFNEENYTPTNQGGSGGRQLVPGLLLIQQTSKSSFESAESFKQPPGISSSSAKKNETSKKPSSSSSSPLPSTINRDGVRPKDQLFYLAQLMGFQVEYSDYPKGNHGEYLTIVTLSTDPPQICHGAGCDTEQSQDKASITALQMLSELGLHNVKKQQEETIIDSTLIEGSND